MLLTNYSNKFFFLKKDSSINSLVWMTFIKINYYVYGNYPGRMKST